MSSFDLKRLRYFIAVAELGSATRAANVAARIVNPHIRRKVCFVRRSGSAMSRAAQELAALVFESLSMLITTDMWPGAMLPGAGIPKLV